ncbi:hypothetical protein SAMN05421821_1174 [Mucilaginibacter lappiensis]|uniref:Uncharacterized protein n=1 Tax=Mucilaginibacter lappiensis TaxID=354630 RepID=A0ABR6PRI4_9SPHI|nr:hypothetical protein [Mucilaginibacter lappiensis]SIR96762.1 hypothetical protein SAMN05421821_1174 [Mucilaginibacter lappiensis]
MMEIKLQNKYIRNKELKPSAIPSQRATVWTHLFEKCHFERTSVGSRLE